MSQLGNSWKGLDTRILAAFDRDVQEFKIAYCDLSDSDKKEVRDWLQQLADISSQAYSLPLHAELVSVKLHVEHQWSTEEGEVVYSGSAYLNPAMMLKAVESWDAGEDFTPKSGFDTLRD